MIWKDYTEKKDKTVSFKKVERVKINGAKEIKDEDGKVLSKAVEEVKESYIVLATKQWNSENGESLPDAEKEYSLEMLESEKKKFESDKKFAEENILELEKAITDFKKL